MRKLCLLLFCFAVLGTGAAAQAPENLVFEGAGIRGIAYSGAIAGLEQHGVLKNIKRVGGTSAGAITALLLCLNYSATEIEQIIAHTRFQRFNSGRFFVAGGLYRLQKHFGWYRTAKFERWLDALIAAKTGNAAVTFAQLKQQGYKALYVTGTDLTSQKAVVFSHETFPDMRVRDAVRISMSIPLYFEAAFLKADGTLVRHPKKQQGLRVLVDGGFVMNFPIKLFDSTRYTDSTAHNIFFVNNRTIGFRIDSDAQRANDSMGASLAPLPVTTLKQYLTAFYTIIIENLNRQTLTKEDWQRTVSISDGSIGPRIRRLRAAEVQALVENGRHATATFLKSAVR
jgi:NTE family protein